MKTTKLILTITVLTVAGFAYAAGEVQANDLFPEDPTYWNEFLDGPLVKDDTGSAGDQVRDSFLFLEDPTYWNESLEGPLDLSSNNNVVAGDNACECGISALEDPTYWNSFLEGPPVVGCSDDADVSAAPSAE